MSVCGCDGVCTSRALAPRCEEGFFLSSLLTRTHGGITERTSDPSLLRIVKLGVAGEEEKGRAAVSVCYRVALRGLSKRLY